MAARPDYTELHAQQFLELLTCDCELITHHTSSMNLNGPFLSRKPQILEALRHAIDHADMDALTRRRQTKRTL